MFVDLLISKEMLRRLHVQFLMVYLPKEVKNVFNLFTNLKYIYR